MMFAGSKFCPHCGAAAEQAKPVDAASSRLCPDCRVPMQPLLLKQTPLHECQRCYGLWVGQEAFERICADRERQADVLAGAHPPEQHAPAAKRVQSVRYRPCPQCGQLMNRFNFGHVSGVVIDSCKGHGFWFDRDELQRVVDFVQAGGMEVARQKEWRERTDNARRLEVQQRIRAVEQSIAARDDGSLGGIYSIVGDILSD
jgi:Zn-finger nucleic acid-binding protein